MFRATSCVGLLLSACGNRPAAPTEFQAREEFGERVPRLENLENALKDGIRDAGLAKPRPDCAMGEQACFEQVRKHDKEIASTQKAISKLIESWDVACAEITVATAKRGEELSSRVATCAPGRRGDFVDRKIKIGEYDVGWGVYFKNDQVMRRGIAVHREWKDGEATATIEVYFFIDS
jgi:hypothetical protein